MDDLINRQEAIDALLAWEEDSFWDDECLKHRGEPYWIAPSDVIERLPSAQPEQRWVLVTERLPNKDGLYLVTTSKGQVQVHVFSHNGNSEEYWMRCNKAWMYLPEPYEAESEDKA